MPTCRYLGNTGYNKTAPQSSKQLTTSYSYAIISAPTDREE